MVLGFGCFCGVRADYGWRFGHELERRDGGSGLAIELWFSESNGLVG